MGLGPSSSEKKVVCSPLKAAAKEVACNVCWNEDHPRVCTLTGAWSQIISVTKSLGPSSCNPQQSTAMLLHLQLLQVDEP